MYQLLMLEEDYEKDKFIIRCPMPFRNSKPIRPWPRSPLQSKAFEKWGLKYSEWPRRYLPDYCVGWAFVTTPDMAIRLAEVANNLTPAEQRASKVCDYFITGMLRERIPGSGVETLTIKWFWFKFWYSCPYLTELYRHYFDDVVPWKIPYKMFDPQHNPPMRAMWHRISHDFHLPQVFHDLIGYMYT